MKGIFNKLFGKKAEVASIDELVGNLLDQVIQLADLELAYDMHKNESGDLLIELYGKDEEMLTSKEGALLESIQLFVKRVLQHQLPEDKTNIAFDCGGFREKANQGLIELAEKLKGIVLEKGKPVYFRALPPRERKVVHQHLATDARVKSRSVGEGLYKKIKIYPTSGAPAERSAEQPAEQV